MRKNILINDESFIAHLTAEWAETRTYCIECDHPYEIHQTKISSRFDKKKITVKGKEQTIIDNITLFYRYYCTLPNCDCETKL